MQAKKNNQTTIQLLNLHQNNINNKCMSTNDNK